MDNAFFQNTLNSLEEQLAIIDRNGCITFVNDSWKRFGAENGFDPEYGWIGVNYLDVCRTADLHGDAAFVLTHQNITSRKLAEQAVIRSSLHDPLTDLANRRHFDSFMSSEWRRCLRENASICAMMIDLDHFKKFNDEKGHLDGDLCLQAVADILRSQITRGSDISARFGGDEFSVVLGDTPMEGALLVANRIVAKIRDLGMQLATGEAVTVSIGLACGIPGMNDFSDEAALLRLADSALYKAKSGGRNRIEVI